MEEVETLEEVRCLDGLGVASVVRRSMAMKNVMGVDPPGINWLL